MLVNMQFFEYNGIVAGVGILTIAPFPSNPSFRGVVS